VPPDQPVRVRLPEPERLAPDLVKRSYGEPRWDSGAGRAVTSETVTLSHQQHVTAPCAGGDVRNSRRLARRTGGEAVVSTRIEAVQGVIDGGGNTAHGNGDPAQCSNIACN